MPALQAVLRSQVAQAAKGNATAQRALFQTACALEKTIGEQTGPARQQSQTSDLEAVRRIAQALLKLAPQSSDD